jgi:hypothetical protein
VSDMVTEKSSRCSVQAEEGKDEHDHDDQADEVNETVHEGALVIGAPSAARSHRPTGSRTERFRLADDKSANSWKRRNMLALLSQCVRVRSVHGTSSTAVISALGLPTGGVLLRRERGKPAALAPTSLCGTQVVGAAPSPYHCRHRRRNPAAAFAAICANPSARRRARRLTSGRSRCG